MRRRYREPIAAAFAIALIASLSVRWNPWARLAVIWADFASDVPRRTFVAPEELVPSSTIDRSNYLPGRDFRAAIADARQLERPGDAFDVAPWSAYRGLTFSAGLSPWRPLSLGFVASIDVKDPPETGPLRNIGGTLSYTSTCDCWGATLVVNKARDRSLPDFNVLIDLARLGSVAGGTR